MQAGLQKLILTIWAEDAVITDFGTAGGQHVLEEAFEKFDSGDGAVLNLLGLIAAVTERDLSLLEKFQPVIGQSNPENIPA